MQIGSPAGGCLTEEHLDLPLDFYSLKKFGAGIYGITGSVDEAVVRDCLPNKSKNALSEIRILGLRVDEAIKETTVSIGDTELKLAVVNGLASARKTATFGTIAQIMTRFF